MFLAVDPGRRGCGCCIFDSDRRLVIAAYVPNPDREDEGPLACRAMAMAVKMWCATSAPGRVDELVLEWPTTYGGRASKGDQRVDVRDLFTLAGVDAAIATTFPLAKVVYFEPHAWKGSVKKPKSTREPYAIQTRVVQRLDETERGRIVWSDNKKLCWDIADGLGVGLHALGRFDRHRVIHRG